MLWRASFKRDKPLTVGDVEEVLATDGPAAGLLPGAFQQQTVKAVGTGALPPNSSAQWWAESDCANLAGQFAVSNAIWQ